MIEETKTEQSDPKVARAESKPVKTELSHNEGVRADRWSIRRAELKRQKRRAHRRRINAANTSG